MMRRVKSVLNEFEDVRLLLGIGGGVAAFLVTVAGFLHDQLNLSEDTILNFAYFASFIFIMGFMYFGVNRRGVRIGKVEAAAGIRNAVVDTQLVQERSAIFKRMAFYDQMVQARDRELLQVQAELAQVRIENTGLVLENDSLKNVIFQAYKEVRQDEIHKILKPVMDSMGRGDFAGNGND